MTHLIVINLNRRKDRWERTSLHLQENKHHLQFIDSIHRLEAVEHQQPAKGCMLSHMKAIQMAKAQHWDKVMVCEDDVRFQPNVKNTWEQVQSELESHPWSVVFGASVRFRPKDFQKVSPHTLKLKCPNGIVTGTHCVVYHSRVYDEIIRLVEHEVMESYPFHLDLLLSSKLNSPTHPIVLTIPFMALITEQDTSDIRLGRDTSTVYRNIVEAQRMANIYTCQ